MPDLDPARPLVWLAGAVSADRHAVRMEDFLACRHVGIYYAVCGERIEANPPYAWVAGVAACAVGPKLTETHDPRSS